jgi:hypothetical protein
MRAADFGRLVALAAIWGASFLFTRIVAPVMGPVLTADLRMLVAGLALVAYLLGCPSCFMRIRRFISPPG